MSYASFLFGILLGGFIGGSFSFIFGVAYGTKMIEAKEGEEWKKIVMDSYSEEPEEEGEDWRSSFSRN